MFSLVKWYLDLVTEDGSAFLAYAAGLRWGTLRMRYASMLLSRPGAGPREAATVRRVRSPVRSGRSIVWHSDTLDVGGRWLARGAVLRAQLLRTAEGAIDWVCLTPRARGRVRVGSLRLEGVGYVERLRLGIPPWKLPFRMLRWGRFASPRRSLVWIAWQGEPSVCRVWLDAEEQPGARVSDTGVDRLDGDGQLGIDVTRVLRERRVLTALADAVPSLVRRLPGPLSGMHELKWLGHGRLSGGDAAPDTGWTVHEVVSW